MNKVLFLAFCWLVLVEVSLCQTTADLRTKYPVVTSYEVRPGILMTPRYTPDGLVCEMSIQKQSVTRSGVRLDFYMNNKLIKELIDELVPSSVRGKPWNGSDWNGVVVTSGVINTTTYGFENLSVAVVDRSDEPRLGSMVVVITWKNRACKEEGKPIPLSRYP